MKPTRTPSASLPSPSSLETSEGRLCPATRPCWVASAAPSGDRLGPKAITLTAAVMAIAAASANAARPRAREPISANGSASAAEALTALAPTSAKDPRASDPVRIQAAPAARRTPIRASLWAPGIANTSTSGLRA